LCRWLWVNVFVEIVGGSGGSDNSCFVRFDLVTVMEEVVLAQEVIVAEKLIVAMADGSYVCI
jgi:hypothetical protein